MNIFVIDLKNQPGELAHVCEELARRGANIYLSGTTAGDHGLVSLTASDEGSCRAALDEARVSYTEHPALKVRSADQPGEAGRIARKLSDAGVNIDCLLPISICGGEVVLALSTDKLDDARRALGDQVVS